MITKDELEKKVAELEKEIQEFVLESNKQLAFYQGKMTVYKEMMEALYGTEPGS